MARSIWTSKFSGDDKKMKKSYIPIDGSKSLNGDLFENEDSNHLLIIHSAMGVPFKIYEKIAIFLKEKGLSVFLYDPRGVGQNDHFADGSAQ